MDERQPSEDLTAFVQRLGKGDALKVEEQLGAGFVRLRVSEAERRQARHDIRCIEDVVIELLRNARDASARQLFVATAREGNRRTLTILDDGCGVPRNLWDAIFEARVTSKLESIHMDRWGVHGRGMALYSIKQNVHDARVMDSVVGAGMAVRVISDVKELPERSDQSTWPKLVQSKAGEQADEQESAVARGPHNIIRTCCEFALEEQGCCRVYLGSPADIVATLRVRAPLPNGDLLHRDLDDLGIIERFAVASDAHELYSVSQGLGLDISERTAHRILSGQIAPQPQVLARLGARPSTQRHAVDLARDRRGLRLATSDAQQFCDLMARDFSVLAERYYLSLAEPPRIRVAQGQLTVTFRYQEED